MMMTEDEAAETYCHKLISWRDVRRSEDVCCSGSMCMAWRWSEWNVDESTHQRLDPTKGYCGLAGKP